MVHHLLTWVHSLELLVLLYASAAFFGRSSQQQLFALVQVVLMGETLAVCWYLQPVSKLTQLDGPLLADLRQEVALPLVQGLAQGLLMAREACLAALPCSLVTSGLLNWVPAQTAKSKIT